METQYSTKPADAYKGALPTRELRQLIRSAAQVETTSEEQAADTWMRILAEIEKRDLRTTSPNGPQ